MKKTVIILLGAVLILSSDKSEAGIGPGVGIMNSAIFGTSAIVGGTLATWGDGTQSTWGDGTNAQWSGN